MRNPIRLKNLSWRFLPLYALGGVALVAVRPTPAGLLAGGAMVVAGAALRSWGAGHLVKTDRLTTTGPYAHIRHPLYAGTLLIGVGFALTAGGAVAVVGLAGLVPWFFLHYFPRKERSESARLERAHGEAYARYRDRVPALLPRLRAGRAAAPRARAAGERWSAQRYADNNELGALLAVLAGLLAFALRGGWPG